MTNIADKIKLHKKKLVILGLGLIGGSIAKACKNLDSYLIEAFDLNPKTIESALKQKLIINSYQFGSKLSENDLVAIAAPLSAYKELMEKIRPDLSINTAIFDIGSLKSFAQNQASLFLKEKSENFVACHPIAGSEKSGLDNASVDLFFNKKVIITPSPKTDQEAISKISDLWQDMGLEIKIMSAEEHDKIFALISHLPQFLSFGLAEIFDEELKSNDLILKKHLRLENSNQLIFQEIFDLNIINLRDYLELLVNNLVLFKEYLLQEKYSKILDLWQEALQEPKEIELDSKLIDEPQIIARIILVASFVLIKDVKRFINHAGSGFKDFTVILACLQILLKNQQLACKILAEHKLYLLEFLSKMIVYAKSN